MFPQTLNPVEERIQKELARRQKGVLLEQTKVGQIISGNEEIKKIKGLVNAGYNNRHNLALIAEKQAEIDRENVSLAAAEANRLPKADGNREIPEGKGSASGVRTADEQAELQANFAVTNAGKSSLKEAPNCGCRH